LVGPTGAVFAFEPSDYAFPRLTTMIESNRLTNVHPIKCALADTPGDRFLYGGVVDEEASDLRTATMVPNDNPRKALVRTETLDGMADELQIRHIDFMKIDVDGLEPMVLRGGERLIREGRISNIMLECAEYWFQHMNTSTAELVERMRGQGYTKIARVEGSSEFSTYLFQR
jgi:FkbM family methyltransferase